MKQLDLVKQILRPVCDRLRSSDQGLTATVDLATLIACADGDIDPDERAALYTTINTLMGDELNEQVLGRLVRSSLDHIGKAGAVTRAHEVGTTLKERGLAEDVVTFGIAIALASRGIDPAERRALDRVAESAGISAEQVDGIIARLQKETADATSSGA